MAAPAAISRPRLAAGRTARRAAPTPAPAAPRAPTRTELLVREILARVADKWTLVVIDELADGGELRFSALRRRVGGVSQKMLTKTLRELERDGLVTRRVYPEVPPRVEYKLTRLGESLGDAVCGIWTWCAKHADAIDRARRAHARRRDVGGATGDASDR